MTHSSLYYFVSWLHHRNILQPCRAMWKPTWFFYFYFFKSAPWGHQDVTLQVSLWVWGLRSLVTYWWGNQVRGLSGVLHPFSFLLSYAIYSEGNISHLPFLDMPLDSFRGAEQLVFFTGFTYATQQLSEATVSPAQCSWAAVLPCFGVAQPSKVQCQRGCVGGELAAGWYGWGSCLPSWKDYSLTLCLYELHDTTRLV